MAGSNFRLATNLREVHISDLRAYCAVEFIGESTPFVHSTNAYLYLDGEKIKDLVVPDGVTRIGEYTFLNCNLTSVTLPDSVTKFGSNAFQGNLFTEFEIPSGVTELNGTFESCSNLESIVIPNNVSLIGNQTFSGCTNLRSATFLGNVTSIGSYAFTSTKLERIVIPESIATIGFGAFRYCTILSEVTIPDSLEILGSSAFYGCSSLKSIEIPQSITNIEDNTFTDCVSLSSVVIPDNITSIGKEAFSGCTSLEEIVISDSSILTSVGEKAFYNCSSLRSIAFPDGVNTLGSKAFMNCADFETVKLPESLSTIPVSAFSGCGSLEAIEFPVNISEISEEAFKDCTSLSEITFLGDAPSVINTTAFKNVTATCYFPADNDTYTSELCAKSFGGDLTWQRSGADMDSSWCGNHITWSLSEAGVLTLSGTGAMYDYSEADIAYAPWYDSRDSIMKIVVSDGITYIGARAFYNCNKATSVSIPQSIITIGEQAFEKCSVTSLIWPEQLASVGDYAFRSAKLSGILDLPDTLVTVGTGVFKSCTNITAVVLPDSMTSIPDEMFQSCSKLVDVDFPEMITRIGTRAFSGCYKLNSVVLPEGLVEIGEYAFAACGYHDYGGYSFNSVILPSTVRVIGTKAFSSCMSLISINLPEGLERIQEYTFHFCKSLNEIVVPASVKVIESDAFLQCHQLFTIRFCGDAPEFEKSALACLYQKTTDYMTAYYPANNPTWTEDVFQNYGNLKVEWIPYEPGGDGTEGSGGSGGTGTPGGDTEEPGGDESGEGSGGTGDGDGGNTSGGNTGDGTGTGTGGEGYNPGSGGTGTGDPCKNGHTLGAWKIEKYPSGSSSGEIRRYCAVCLGYEYFALEYVENRLYLEDASLQGAQSVGIDGREYAVQTDGRIYYADLADGNSTTLVLYGYHEGDPSDIHTQYPVSMKVWTLSNADGIYTAVRAEELDNILQYSGSSIRVTGKQGIRMITSIEKAKKKSLVEDGLAGYTLKEYGTVVAWVSQMGNDPLILGKSYAKSNYAYKKGVADPVFAYDGSLMQYTNVLTGFSLDQCRNDLAMRPYMILMDADGNEFTLYGGLVTRSIGYIALQNKDVFTEGTEAYDYVRNIIQSVYGDQYDEA